MKVWIVIKYIRYKGQDLMAICSTQEKAESWIKNNPLPQKKHYTDFKMEWYDIQEWRVE